MYTLLHTIQFTNRLYSIHFFKDSIIDYKWDISVSRDILLFYQWRSANKKRSGKKKLPNEREMREWRGLEGYTGLQVNRLE